MLYEEFRQIDGYFYVIYKIVNKLDNKFYIGQHKTKNLDDGYMGSGIRIKRAIEKYGKDNFEKQYLHFVNSLNELIDKEIELVNEELISDENCYNISLGGQGDTTEAIKRFQYLLKNDIEYKTKFRKNVSIALKKLWGENGHNWAGKKHKEETKIKISEKLKIASIGEGNSQFGTCWIYNDKESIRIKKEELDSYLNDGWNKGRRMKF